MNTAELHHFDYLEITGEDSISFLQGQVSCNMDLLSESNSLRGALCNLKGRVIANFIVFKNGPNIIMQTQRNVAKKVMTILAKYAVFSKVEMRLLATPFAALGCFGEDTYEKFVNHFQWAANQTSQVCASDSLVWIQMPSSSQALQLIALNEDGVKQLEQIAQSNTPVPVEHWHRLETEQGHINVTETMSELYTPQLLNYDLTGIIDFKKGCYTGQEVVARMFYRSKAKKRLALLSCPEPIEADDVVVFGDESADILFFNNLESSHSLLLSILPTNLAESPSPPALTINGESHLQILTMPYTE